MHCRFARSSGSICGNGDRDGAGEALE